MDDHLIRILNQMYISNSKKIDELTNQNFNIINNIMEIYRNQITTINQQPAPAPAPANQHQVPANQHQEQVPSNQHQEQVPINQHQAQAPSNQQPLNQHINTLLRNFNLPFNIPDNLQFNIPDNLPIYFNYQIHTSNIDPVIVHPSNEQINNATENLLFGNIINPLNTNCPISLEQFTNTSNVTIIKHCKHIFNTNNLMNWFRTNCKCPVCRFDIREYNANNDTNNDTNNDANNDTNNDTDTDTDSENENEINIPIQSLINNIQTLSESPNANNAQQIVSDFINIFNNL